MQKTLLTFVDDIYEDLELWYPKLRLEEAGFATVMAALELKTYTGKHGYPAKADALINEVLSKDFCGLLISGGFMPINSGATQKFFRSRVNFSSRENWSHSFVRRLDSHLRKNLERQARHRLTRHQGRFGKRWRNLVDNPSSLMQSDFQPHLATSPHRQSYG